MEAHGSGRPRAGECYCILTSRIEDIYESLNVFWKYKYVSANHLRKQIRKYRSRRQNLTALIHFDTFLPPLPDGTDKRYNIKSGTDKVGHLHFEKDPLAFDFNTESCTNKAKMSSEPTIFNNNENEEFSSPRVDVVDKGKQSAVSAPQPFNPSDPFDVFDADIVRIIITELDATDTETLRRVSKLWKAISEFYCGRTFLRQHFPEAAGSLSENVIGSVEEENLRFRRHCKCLFQVAVAKLIHPLAVYHRQSFQLGYATRVFPCTGASSWDLKNDTLLWSNSDGEVHFRILRANIVGVQGSARVIDENLDLRRLPSRFRSIEQVSLLNGGDLIVQSFVEKDNIREQRDSSVVRDRSTARVNQAGRVLWEIITCARTWSKPVIGKNEVFFIEEGPFNEQRLNYDDPILVKYSLQDGSIVPGFEPVGSEQRGKKIDLLGEGLILTNNEKFAVWTDIDGIISIITVSNRKRLTWFLRPATAVVSKSSIDESLWVIHRSMQDAPTNLLDDPPFINTCSYLLSWKENITGLRIQPIIFPSMLQSCDKDEWVFDADSAVLLHKTYAFQPKREETAELAPQEPIEDRPPLGRLRLATTHQVPSIVPRRLQFETKTAPVEISLPTSTGQRQPLDVEISVKWEGFMWNEPWRSSLRMAETYLIYHSHDEDELLLIDFWPNW